MNAKMQNRAAAVDAYFEQFAGAVFTNVEKKNVIVTFRGSWKMAADVDFDFNTQTVVVTIYSAGERIKKKTVADLVAAEAMLREYKVMNQRRRRKLNS